MQEPASSEPISYKIATDVVMKTRASTGSPSHITRLMQPLGCKGLELKYLRGHAREKGQTRLQNLRPQKEAMKDVHSLEKPCPI